MKVTVSVYLQDAKVVNENLVMCNGEKLSYMFMILLALLNVSGPYREVNHVLLDQTLQNVQ